MSFRLKVVIGVVLAAFAACHVAAAYKLESGAKPASDAVSLLRD
jgi:hypothetical protein